jgi:cyclic pyranopterin phosphate synthase
MSDTNVALARVLAGIDAARDVGLSPVKVNMLVRRGVNHHCVVAMAEHFRRRGEILRFIEYMDVGSTNGWRLAEVVPAAEILDAIEERWPLEPLAPTRMGEVASRYRYRDGAGEVGFIHSVSQPFCRECTRARLSADGKLYTCLFAQRGEDLRALLRAGADEVELRARLGAIWRARGDRYSAERSRRGRDAARDRVSTAPTGTDATRPPRRRELPKIEMSYIGG